MDSFLQLLIDKLYKLGDRILSFNSNSYTKFQLRVWVILVTNRTNSFYLSNINILLGDGPAITNALGLKFSGNTKTPYRSYLFQGQDTG